MGWHKHLTQLEYIFIGAFFFFYLLYFIRMVLIARKLKTTIRSIAFKFILRSVYFSLLIIALLEPSFGDIKKDIKSVGKDIYVAVDLSHSMLANDIKPSRLEKAKYELKSIVKALNSDRIGLIIFSGDAYLQCPLTYDHNALNLFIETLNIDLLPHSGTDFKKALLLALNKHLTDEAIHTEKTNKLVLLVSDGEQSSPNINQTIKRLNKKGVRVFTLGIGSEEGSTIPVRNGFKKDENDKIVISKLARVSLSNISKMTAGEYFEISNEINEVGKLITAINKIKGTTIDEKKIDIAANKYFYFLLFAVFLIIIDCLITVSTIKI